MAFNNGILIQSGIEPAYQTNKPKTVTFHISFQSYYVVLTAASECSFATSTGDASYRGTFQYIGGSTSKTLSSFNIANSSQEIQWLAIGFLIMVF